MSAKQALARTMFVMIGAQALAVAALAQTPDASTTQRPSDTATNTTGTSTTTPRSTTGSSSSSATQTGGTSAADRSTMDHSNMDDSMDHSQMKAAKMKPVTPQSFATQAAVMGQSEIALAQLALKNTKNEEIRIYAERLVKDHTAANNKLKEIASNENLQLPQSLDAKHQQTQQQLSGLKDAAFDREYKKHMTTSHDEAVALFESASQTQQMPSELKAFAASTLPTLEKHKKMAAGLDIQDGA